MSVLIKGMTMPTTGLYFVSVDNTGGKDKTVVAVEHILGNSDVRQIVGSFEVVPIPSGRLIDADALMQHEVLLPMDGGHLPIIYASYVRNAPTIIESEGEE